MFKKIVSSVLLVLALCGSQDVFPVNRCAPRDLVPWTEQESELVLVISELFDFAMSNDQFEAPCHCRLQDGGIVELSLEQYPQSLVGSQYRAESPSAAMGKFEQPRLRMNERLLNGGCTLRIRAHATRSPKPLCPFLISVKVWASPSLRTADFLQHPALLEDDLFRQCLTSMEISGCCIKKFDAVHFTGYSNPIDLDFHDNVITQISGSLQDLETLNLSNNAICRLWTVFAGGWGRLQSLDLSHNNILQLANGTFNGLVGLYTLDLSHNLLTSAGVGQDAFDGVCGAAPFFKLTIDLSNNALVDFPPLPPAVADKLMRLNLDGNPIMDVSGVAFDRFYVLHALSLVYDDRTEAENDALAAQVVAARLRPECRLKVRAVVVAADDVGYTTP